MAVAQAPVAPVAEEGDDGTFHSLVAQDSLDREITVELDGQQETQLEQTVVVEEEQEGEGHLQLILMLVEQEVGVFLVA
jgi:hypothetical protein